MQKPSLYVSRDGRCCEEMAEGGSIILRVRFVSGDTKVEQTLQPPALLLCLICSALLLCPREDQRQKLASYPSSLYLRFYVMRHRSQPLSPSSRRTRQQGSYQARLPSWWGVLLIVLVGVTLLNVFTYNHRKLKVRWRWLVDSLEA